MIRRFRKSNGPTEGLYNKMMMTRRAYGFRNFEKYRLRVITHCRWDGIVNRV
jgi:transposase